MNAAARKAAAGGGGGMGRAPALVAAGAFLISYNFFVMLLRGGGAGAGAAAGARDPVVAMPAWMREARRRPFHVALTATDTAYSRWQCRTAGSCTTGTSGCRRSREARPWAGSRACCTRGSPTGSWTRSPPSSSNRCPPARTTYANRKQQSHLFLSPFFLKKKLFYLRLFVRSCSSTWGQCGVTEDFYMHFFDIKFAAAIQLAVIS